MKRITLAFLAIMVLILAVSLLPSHRQSIHSTTDLVARNDDYEGNSACQECQAQADADWWQCVQDAGGDIGDADCAASRNIAKSRCLTTFCISSTTITNGAVSAVLNEVSPTAQCQTIDCQTVRNICYKQAMMLFSLCYAVTDNLQGCNDEMNSNYRSCAGSCW